MGDFTCSAKIEAPPLCQGLFQDRTVKTTGLPLTNLAFLWQEHIEKQVNIQRAVDITNMNRGSKAGSGEIDQRGRWGAGLPTGGLRASHSEEGPEPSERTSQVTGRGAAEAEGTEKANACTGRVLAAEQRAGCV